MIQKPIEPSVSFVQASDRFLDGLREWAHESVARYASAEPSDGHDQMTYATGWEPYLMARPDAPVVEFLKTWRDRVASHFADQGKWRHGYWTMQEAHHGTEHFELFLGSLWRVDPSDHETAAQFVDAAEHIGNWSDDVPAWWDEGPGLFKSFYFGAAGIETRPGSDLNVPDHLRLVNMLLLADAMTERPRYIELASRYAGLWADALVATDALPIGLLPGGPVLSLTDESGKEYRSFAGMVGDLNEQVERAENILASGGVDAFLTLWERTGEAKFKAAAEKVLDVLATQLPDPDAGVAADVIRSYRRTTRDARYDAVVEAAMADLDPFGFESLGMEQAERTKRKPAGIGKRSDAPKWFEDGRPRRHSPVLLAAAAELRGDEALATRAVDLARTYFAIACERFPDGRKHGCAAATISAIARGHGRENNTGMATGVLGPLIAVFGD